MRVLDRIRTLSGATATASAVWALLVGGTIAMFALNLLLFDPCVAPDGSQYGICDPPRPPGAGVLALVGLLLFSGIANILKGWLWPLVGAWTLMVCVPLGDAILFLIPSVRESAGFRGEFDTAEVLQARLLQPTFMFFAFGLSLALVSAFAARRHKKF